MRNEFCCGLYAMNETTGAILVDPVTKQPIDVGQANLEFFGMNEGYVVSILGDLGIMLLFALSYLWLFYLVLEYYW